MKKLNKNKLKLILLLFLAELILIKCQKLESSKNVMNIPREHYVTNMSSITRYKKGKDYILSLKLSSKQNITNIINRIEKNITIIISKTILKEENININMGLIDDITLQNSKNNGKIIINLKRNIRHEINFDDNSNLSIILKNIMDTSSLKPTSKDIKDFHFKTFNIDLHNDLLFQLFMKNLSLAKEYSFTESDLPKLTKGGVHSVFFSVWIPDYFLKNADKLNIYKDYFPKFDYYKGKPFEMTIALIDKLLYELEKQDKIKLAFSSKDLITNWKRGVKSALIGLEGAHPLEGKLERLKILYDKGIRYIGITWSNTNDFADAAGDFTHNGLSPLGKKLIKEMMKLGMLIDVSHCSDNTFYDILKITDYKYPIIASHSSSRVLLNHKRNLTDDMLNAIKKSNGIVGIVFHSGFLTKNKRATIENVLNHIDYFVEKTSINNVAIGSDFDGFINTPLNLENMSKLPNLTLGLYNRGYSHNDIEKIMGKNFLRVFRKVEKLKQN